MNKINISLLALLGLLFMVACDTDNDSNPVLKDATEFKLNLPPYASNIYDLEHSEVVELTFSQPDFGFPLALVYSVQLSLTGEFVDAAGDVPATYQTLATTYSSTRIDVDALEVALALVTLSGIEDQDEFNEVYQDPTKLYIRMHAALSNGMKPTVSNVIELPQVQAYYALPSVDLPTNMYINGSIVGWDWNNAFEMVPVHSTPGKFWRMVYFDTDAAFKFNSVKEWNGGEIGYTDTNFPNPDYAGISDSNGDISIGNAGWYIVVVTVTLEGRNLINTVEFYEPNVYLFGLAAGGVWGASPDNLFTVPETADGEFVSPAFIGDVPVDSDSGVRACIILEGQEWWHTEFIVIEGKIEYRGTGDDQTRVPGTIGQRLYFNFTSGIGSIQ